MNCMCWINFSARDLPCTSAATDGRIRQENMDIDQSNTNYLSQVASSRSLSRFSYGLFYSIAGPAALRFLSLS